MEKFIPKTLKELVVSGSDKLIIDLADDDDLELLTGVVRIKKVRYVLSSWSVIKVTAFQTSMFLLAGYTEEGEVWCTSPILAMDMVRLKVLTENSVYGIEEKRLGEPDLYIRLHVAYLLRSWDIDGQIGEGVEIYDVRY